VSFQLRQTTELIQIAGAGGGFVLDASLRPTADLIQIAGAAKRSGARLLFRGLTLRPTADLMQIAAAGGGAVQFSGDEKPA
jgi:hypothetical protein